MTSAAWSGTSAERRTSSAEFLNAAKLLDKAADAAATPQTPVPQIPPTGQTNGTPSTVEGETAFDREMREARERLKAQQDA